MRLLLGWSEQSGEPELSLGRPRPHGVSAGVERQPTKELSLALTAPVTKRSLSGAGQVQKTMWSPCLTNDSGPILAPFSGRQRAALAFLEGA